MTNELQKLEDQRGELIALLAQLGDFRAGSITGFTRRCGKPSCHCARKGDSGHGPTLRLTYKVGGKSLTESLADQEAVRKAEAEIAEFRRFKELTKKLVEVNLKICRLRGAGEQVDRGSKKNRKRRSSRKSGVK